MRLTDDDVGPPPEGGKEAWRCVFGAFFLLFCFFGFFTSFGTLQEYYLENQLRDHTKSDVAWISSVSSFAVFAGSLSAGRYFDSHGARFLSIAGTVLSISALVAIAFCREYYQFMLAHLLFGISGSFLYSPATAVSGHWFLRKRSTAVGIVVCGSGLGGVIYPIALRRLFDQVGFRNTMLIMAGMNAVLMMPSWFWMKARLPPRTPPPLRSLARPWQESRYICLVVGSCMNMMILFSPYFNAPLYTTSNQTSSTITYYSVAFIQAGSFLGRALSGILADKFGVWNIFVINGFGLTVTLLAFWTGVPLPDAVVVIGIISYGFASGAWITLVAASCATISPTREFGMRLGMLWSCTAILQSFGPVISGALVTASDDKFTYAAVFCALSALIGTTITIAPRILSRLDGRAATQTTGKGGQTTATES